VKEKTIEQQYVKLKEKYDLPVYGELNRVFEIENIEETSFVLREVIRLMYDKLDKFAKALEEVLQPESHLAGLYESGQITELQKKGWYLLYRKIMKVNRKSIVLAAICDEKEEAKEIKDLWKLWNEIHKDLADFGNALTEAWGNDDDEKADTRAGYLG
jgi:hypothetical protein